MKSKLLIIAASLLVAQGCQQAGEMATQMRFISSQAQKYGGSWKGSMLNDCYELEITNSERLHPDTDSLDYHATAIGRAFIDQLDYNFTCMTLELVDEVSVGFASSSTGTEATYNLALIRSFKDIGIPEYLTIRKAHNTIHNLQVGDTESAQYWFDKLTTAELAHPFANLAKAEFLKAQGDASRAWALIDSLSSSYPREAQLHRYIATSYFLNKNLDKALEEINVAHEAAPENIEITLFAALLHQLAGQWEEMHSLTSSIIKIDSTIANAYYYRAYASFQMDQINSGCDDLAAITKLDPEIVFADSIARYCR